MNPMTYPPCQQREAAAAQARLLLAALSLWTVSMDLTCSEAFDEKRSSPSLEKLFARTSHVIPHRIMVRRRKNQRL